MLTLTVLPETLAICRFPAGSAPPRAALTDAAGFWSLTRTANETSLVVSESCVEPSCTAERGWRAFEVEGPLDFSLTGIVAGLAAPLAEAGIPIFVISTFDTDYVLVREHDLDRAVTVLERAGHTVRRSAQ